MIEGLGTRLELEQFIKSCILSIYDHEAEYVGMRNKYVCNAVCTDCAIVTKCSNYATKEVRLESVKEIMFIIPLALSDHRRYLCICVSISNIRLVSVILSDGEIQIQMHYTKSTK